jgi:hypothetical protein
VFVTLVYFLCIYIWKVHAWETPTFLVRLQLFFLISNLFKKKIYLLLFHSDFFLFLWQNFAISDDWTLVTDNSSNLDCIFYLNCFTLHNSFERLFTIKTHLTVKRSWWKVLVRLGGFNSFDETLNANRSFKRLPKLLIII